MKVKNRTGDCSGLTLKYTPTTTVRTLLFGDSLVVTIPATATEPWDHGDRTLTLVVSPGFGVPTELVRDSDILTVKKNN